MRLVTFQDKYVTDYLEQAEVEGYPTIYECKEINFLQKEENLYNKVINKMKEQLKISMERQVIPVWCWVVPKDQELNDEYIDILYNRYTPKCDTLTVLELDVPKEFIFITNFDLWYDLKFKIRFNEQVTDKDIEGLFIKQKGATIQACIPFIDKQFIKSCKIIDDPMRNDYSQTEDEVAQLQSKGQFLDEF